MKTTHRIGCSGWSYKEWKGLFYPNNLPSAKYLGYYSEYFNTVEVNNTFYRLPSLTTVRNWYQSVSNEFKFSLKVNKNITHTKRLKQAREELNAFYGFSDILKDKMGAFLFQFPKSFVFTDERLERLLVSLDPTYQNVIEFRHPSWWNPKTYEALNSINASFCTVSGMDVPEDLIILKEHAYIRLHGDPEYISPYSEKDLQSWKRKIRDSSLKNLWVYFNNTAQGHAPDNALRMVKLLDQK